MSEGHKPGYTSKAKVVSAKNNIVSFFIADNDAIAYYKGILTVDGVLNFTYPSPGDEIPGTPAEPQEPEPSA